MPYEVDWLIVGDFNLLRRLEDRNREGADVNEMFLFNEAIKKLDLIELPIQGRQYTWTNKQFPPSRKIGLVFYFKLLDFKLSQYFGENSSYENM